MEWNQQRMEKPAVSEERLEELNLVYCINILGRI